MSAESDFRAVLLAAPAITALVGQRVAVDRMEEGAPFPFIVFARSSSEMQYAIDGALHGTMVVLEVQCWADNVLAAGALADAVANVMLTQLPHQVIGRSSGYDPDTGRSLASLTVYWWELP